MLKWFFSVVFQGFFCVLNTPRGPGHPGKIPGTSRIPLFETQGRQSFEGGHEVFGHHPFAWKTPTPPGGLRTQKLNLCALFSCLTVASRGEEAEKHRLEPLGRRKGLRGRFGGESRGHPARPDLISVLSCTRLRVPPVALQVSRYMCRS